MNASLFALTLVAVLALPCLDARAQRSAEESSVEPGELVIDPDLAHARYLRDVGAGLTIGGLATTGLGTGLMFGLGGWGGVIGGGTFEGLGGVLGLVGIPIWIVGAVRSDVLAASEGDRDGVAWSYELAGMVTTLLGLGLSLTGTLLLLTGIGAGSGSYRADSARAEETMRAAGGIMIPIGVFIALFIGTPMWAEGARF